MGDGCDGLRGPEKWLCRLNKLIVKIGNVFALRTINVDKDGNSLATQDNGDGTASAKAVLQSSENHIGTVSGDSDPIRVIIPNTAETYDGTSSPVVIGGIVEIPNAMRVNGGTGVLSRAGLINIGTEQINLYISFYSAQPSGNYANKQAPTNNANDLKNLHLGTLQANSSDWKKDGVGGTVGIPGENMVLKSASESKSLYAVVKLTGTPQALANANALTLLIDLLRD